MQNFEQAYFAIFFVMEKTCKIKYFAKLKLRNGHNSVHLTDATHTTDATHAVQQTQWMQCNATHVVDATHITEATHTAKQMQ